MEQYGFALVPLFIAKDDRQLLIENAHHSLELFRVHHAHLIQGRPLTVAMQSKT